MHPDAHPGRKLIAQMASARAARELLDNAALANGPLLTMRNPRQAAFRWMHSPEVYLIDYDCDMPAPELRKLAKERFQERMRKKVSRWLRYERQHGRTHLKHANSCGNQNPVHPMGAYDGVEQCGCRRPCGVIGTRPYGIILDDIHEAQSEIDRAKTLAWYDEHLGRAPH